MKSHVVLPGFVLAMFSCTLLGLAQEPKDTPSGRHAESTARGLGLARSEAIEVCGPKGERAYLSRLRCPDDRPPSYERQGSVGFRNEVVTKEDEQAAQDQVMNDTPVKPGVKDFHMLDAYGVQCSGKTYQLFLDMYHCGGPEPSAAPPGFTLAKKGKRGRS